jgi:hypothetical protein
MLTASNIITSVIYTVSTIIVVRNTGLLKAADSVIKSQASQNKRKFVGSRIQKDSEAERETYRDG